jgi:hypothetical protein
MAQTGYTPILIYSSSTAAQAPAAGNLTNSTLGSELAINITDGKLFYKDNANAVQVIAWKVTPTTAGGTGLTSYTAGDLLYYATGTTLTKLAIGASTNILTSTGSAPQWTAPSSITVGKATNLDGGAAGSVPYQSGAGATTFLGIGTANTVLTSSGSAPQWSNALSLAGNLSAANISVTDTNWIGWGNFASRFTGSGGGPVNVVTNSVTAGTWDASQNYTFYGNLIQGTAAKGINFTANTPAAGMTSQLLNWYEEGTFTAGLSCGSGSITLNSSFNTCSYTRIGRQVTVTGYLQVSSVSTPSGFLTLTGLPFTINSANSGYPSAIPFLNTTAAITGTPVMLGYAGTTTVNFRRMSGGSAIDDMATYFGAGSQIIFTLVYIV